MYEPKDWCFNPKVDVLTLRLMYEPLTVVSVLSWNSLNICLSSDADISLCAITCTKDKIISCSVDSVGGKLYETIYIYKRLFEQLQRMLHTAQIIF